MNDEQRFALHFGPYQTPLFKFGDIVMDEVRGEVTIVGLSAVKLQSPGHDPATENAVDVCLHVVSV